MYGYNKINSYINDETTSIDNMNINGTPLSNLVDGYRQLVVSGRDLLSQEVTSYNIPSRDGYYVNNVKSPSRLLTIQYHLQAETSSDLRNRFNQLNKALSGKQVKEFTFDDEPDWHYYGYLEGASSVVEDRLSLLSSFNIMCPDPYAYSSLKTSNPVTLEYADEVLPTKIELIGTNTSKIEIKSGTNKIVLNGSYPSGSRITLEWTSEELLIKRGTQNILTDLAWNSYPEAFFLNPGTPVTVKGATLQRIEWRDKKL